MLISILIFKSTDLSR